MISVHDNLVYGYSVSCSRARCVLHTKFPRENQSPEFTDVVFEGVAALQFNDVSMSQSILGEIYEIEPLKFFSSFEEYFRVEEKWGNTFSYLWLPFKYKNEGEFVSLIKEHSLLCYEIDAAWGLNGFIFAKSSERVSRDSEADCV